MEKKEGNNLAGRRKAERGERGRDRTRIGGRQKREEAVLTRR